MNIKIKHVYNRATNTSMYYSLQHPSMADGDDGSVITATIRNAPSPEDALHQVNKTTFVGKLHSCDYNELGPGRIVKRNEL
jgi:hypothetical protein